MNILNSKVQLSNAADFNHFTSIALGFFDGVHIAHKKILKTAVDFAKKEEGQSAVISFKKAPRGYFDPKKNINIQTPGDRIKMFKDIGLDCAYILDFEEYKNISAKEYLNILIKNFNPKYIITGFNHTFGAKNTNEMQGNSEFLRNNEYLGYKYIEIEKMRMNNALVSSTNIKKFIERAYIKEANMLLGYDFNIEGEVIKGLGLARKLGFNTANIKWPENIVRPPYGVYFGMAEYDKIKYKALINWGVKPTINNSNNPVLEVHILNFDKDIYGQNLRVYFKKPLREERKFSCIEELKAAISNDINSINQE